MSSLLTHPETTPACDLAVTSEQEVRAQVHGLLGTLFPRGRVADRRQDTRHAFPQLITLTPAPEEQLSDGFESMVVVGKHLSERGLGFFHHEPLPYRRVIASIQLNKETVVAFLLDVHWCRFHGKGWYESGGRLLQVVEPALKRVA